MKKAYIQPCTNSIKVSLNGLIAASPNSISNSVAGAGSENETVNESRQGGFWDDEE